jgi:hypothetical protein
MKLFEVGSAKSPSSFLGARLRHLGHIVPTDLLAGELSAVCGDYHAGIVLLTRYTIPYPGPFARSLCSLLLSTPALSQTRAPLCMNDRLHFEHDRLHFDHDEIN